MLFYSVSQTQGNYQMEIIKRLRKFTLGNNGVEPTYEIMIEPLP